MGKIKITIQHLSDDNKPQAQISVESPTHADDDAVHEEYISLAGQMIDIMDNYTIDMDERTLNGMQDQLGDFIESDKELAKMLGEEEVNE